MMNRALVTLAALALTPPLAASETDALRPGQEVRLVTTSPSGEPPDSVGRRPERRGLLVAEGDAFSYSLGGLPIRGKLVSVEPQALRILMPGRDEPINVKRAVITSLEVRQKKGQSRGRTAAIGFLAGAGVGALLGFVSGDDYAEPWSFSYHYWERAPRGKCLAFSAGEKAAIYGMLGAGVGALAGFTVGGGSTSWVAVDPTPNLRLSVGPVRDGVGARVRFGF